MVIIMKITIMGYSGSGKSTLARRIAEYYKIDVLHFDSVQFLPNWVIRSQAEKERMTREFLDTHDEWVIDGNYSKLFYEERLEESDLIILMLFNRFSCLYRVWKRYRTYKNMTRPDMGEGCNEKLDSEFVRWVLFDGRAKSARERHKRVCEKYGNKTIIIKNQRELDAFIAKNLD